MTPEEINIAIAEHFGYEFRIDDKQWGNDPDYAGAIGVYAPGGGFIGRYHKDWTQIPNYHGDLNDMHEAEKALFESKPGYYDRAWFNSLHIVCEGIDPHRGWGDVDGRSCKGAAHATALQRAEAFLRTVGKWVD